MATRTKEELEKLETRNRGILKDVMEWCKTHNNIKMEMIADDVNWVVGGTSPDLFVGRYKGKAGVQALLDLHHQAVEVLQWDLTDYIVQEHKCVAVGYERVRFKAANRTVGGPFIYFLTLNDEGKITDALVMRDDMDL